MDSAASRTGDDAHPVDAPELLELAIADESPAGGEAPGGEGAPADAGVLPREAFAQGLAIAFGFAGSLTSLSSLSRAPQRAEFAPAADCLYDAALETPWLRWLIEPSSLWLQRVLVIGAFAAPVALEARAELRERREAARAARAKPVQAAAGATAE